MTGAGDVAELPPCVNGACKRPASVGMVCDRCYSDVAAKLDDMQPLWNRLDPMPSGPIETVPQKPSFESKSPANDHHLALLDCRTLDGPIYTLQKWQIAFWATKTGIHVEPSRYFGVLVAGMILHWPFWARTRRAGEFAAEMGRIWREMAAAVGEFVPERPIGLCDCGALLFWRGNLVCDRCGHSFGDYQHIALRKAVLTYELAKAPFWKTLIRQASPRMGDD